MRADLVDDFDKLVLRVLTQMDAQPGDAATFGEAYAALRTLRDAPVGLLYEVGKDGTGFVAKVEIDTIDEARKAAMNAGSRVRLVPLDTAAGVEK